MNFPLFNERKRLADELSSRIGAMQHMVAGATRLQLTDPMFRQRATQVARVVPPNPHNRVDRNAPKRTPNGFQTTVQIPCAEAHLMEYSPTHFDNNRPQGKGEAGRKGEPGLLTFVHTTPALDADAFNAWLEDITQSLNQWTSYVMTDIHQHNELLNGLFDAAVVKRDHELAALEEFDRKAAI